MKNGIESINQGYKNEIFITTLNEMQRGSSGFQIRILKSRIARNGHDENYNVRTSSRTRKEGTKAYLRQSEVANYNAYQFPGRELGNELVISQSRDPTILAGRRNRPVVAGKSNATACMQRGEDDEARKASTTLCLHGAVVRPASISSISLHRPISRSSNANSTETSG